MAENCVYIHSYMDIHVELYIHVHGHVHLHISIRVYVSTFTSTSSSKKITHTFFLLKPVEHEKLLSKSYQSHLLYFVRRYTRPQEDLCHKLVSVTLLQITF